MDEAWDRVRVALLDADRLVRAVASGRQRNTSVAFRRVELRYVDVRSALMLQVTSYDDTQAQARNIAVGQAAAEVVDELLAGGHANWHVECVDETLQLRVTKKGRPLLHAASRAAGQLRSPDRAHDRAKHRLLDESDPVFRVLGVATSDGRLKPSRTAKFRQVQDFLATIEPVLDDAVALGPGAGRSPESPTRPLRVTDLGCGNAYLTFAAFRYLTSVRQIPVSMIGIDVKAQALAHNTRIAKELDLDREITFIQGSISGAALEEPPDLVLALHACDTATDDAIASAVRWRSPVVVAAPCCHHDIARQISLATSPPGYRLVTRHGILRERLAEVLTDAARAALLRLVGYRVEVIEFVDSEHTPRNTMIRAVRTGAAPSDEAVSDYRALVAPWGIRPALETRLRALRPELDATLR